MNVIKCFDQTPQYRRRRTQVLLTNISRITLLRKSTWNIRACIIKWSHRETIRPYHNLVVTSLIRWKWSDDSFDKRICLRHFLGIFHSFRRRRAYTRANWPIPFQYCCVMRCRNLIKYQQQWSRYVILSSCIVCHREQVFVICTPLARQRSN